MDLNASLSIARLLHSTTWSWNVDSLALLSESLGLQPHQRIPGRATYRFSGGPTCSFYLSAPRILFVESTLDVYLDPEKLTPEALAAQDAAFVENYSRLVRSLSNAIGSPTFEGACTAPGFPKDQNAIRLALWPGKKARFMVAYKHEDPELPLRLCVDVYPASEN